MGVRMVYSEAFKLQVLRELDEGRFDCVEGARRTYGIRGCGTVQAWIRKYGKEHLLSKVVRVETPKEINELHQLRKRVRELEHGLADAHLDLKLEQAYVKLACRAAGIEDVESFKKKAGMKRSTR